MPNLQDLINGMNACEMQSFVSKGLSRSGKPKTNVSAVDENGNRRFVNRVAIGLNEDGTQKWGWALGNAMKPRA